MADKDAEVRAVVAEADALLDDLRHAVAALTTLLGAPAPGSSPGMQASAPPAVTGDGQEVAFP